MRGPAIRIDVEKARVLLNQFQETARFRGWRLLVVAIMDNHMHLVVGTGDETNPTKVLADFKAYGSRALNHRWGKPRSDTWWTYDGSKRKLQSENALRNGVEYVRTQARALVVWMAPEESEP
jgi:REP element-mobilizing transposase RayT